MAENISIVIPVFNERDNVGPLHQKIIAALKEWPAAGGYEIIFVDDVSTDQSFEAIQSIRDVRVVAHQLPAHAGQTSAIKAGIGLARYSLIATLDADLQNDPADLPAMMNKIREGFDFVQGRREKREDPWVRIASSQVANAVRRAILGDPFHDISCTLRLFKKNCVDNIDLFDGAHRFLPYLVLRNGFRVAECGVLHHPRVSGVSKYNIRNRLLKSLRDLIRVKRTNPVPRAR